MENVLLVAYLLIVLALIAVILLQRSEGGGLGMGGNAGGLMTVRGSANLLTRTTAILAALFFASAIGLTILAELNRTMRQLEQSFVDQKGMAFGNWYRSLYASSDPYSGYASWMMPGFLYEASLKSTKILPDLEARYRQAINSLSEKLATLVSAMNPPASVGGGNK